MGSIEDIMYEAYDLGINEEVLKKVTKLKQKNKYKFIDLNHVYTVAFNKIIKKKEKIK